MRTKYKVTLSVLSGIVIGIVGGITAIHAQPLKAPPAYFVAEVDVRDAVAFQRYAEKVPATLAPFNGHYLVRGGKTEALDGEGPKRIAIIAFDSVEKARDWEASPAYQAIKKIRESAAKTRAHIVEGVVPQ
jgi:uncharacterized protein (DUF1330 family)